jgi:hypothetical protein
MVSDEEEVVGREKTWREEIIQLRFSVERVFASQSD